MAKGGERALGQERGLKWWSDGEAEMKKCGWMQLECCKRAQEMPKRAGCKAENGRCRDGREAADGRDIRNEQAGYKGKKAKRAQNIAKADQGSREKIGRHRKWTTPQRRMAGRKGRRR